jgi:hypothetical protein
VYIYIYILHKYHQKVVTEMKKMGGDAPCQADLYNRMKEKTLRSYYNYRFWQPYYHCIVGFASCLEDPRYVYYMYIEIDV